MAVVRFLLRRCQCQLAAYRAGRAAALGTAHGSLDLREFLFAPLLAPSSNTNAQVPQCLKGEWCHELERCINPFNETCPVNDAQTTSQVPVCDQPGIVFCPTTLRCVRRAFYYQDCPPPADVQISSSRPICAKGTYYCPSQQQCIANNLECPQN